MIEAGSPGPGHGGRMLITRDRTSTSTDNEISEASADVTVTLKSGRKLHVFVEHAIGSLERPMTDKDLESKFHSLADEVIGGSRADSLVEACWALAAAKDVHGLVAMATPPTSR